MLSVLYNDSYANIINMALGYDFKPWEYQNTTKNFWTRENCIKATKWCVDTLLGGDARLIPSLDFITIRNGCLYGLFCSVYNNSAYALINDTYPNMFKVWDL